MESLRSKASARKGPRPAAKLSKPDRNVRKSRVDDKIKKRMSTRYAISSPTPADATTPSVPTIPLGLRGPDLDTLREKDVVVQQQAPSKEDLLAMENKLLDVDDFDPDACACVVLNPNILSKQSHHRSQIEARQLYRS
jgi:exocyst complex component 8